MVSIETLRIICNVTESAPSVPRRYGARIRLSLFPRHLEEQQVSYLFRVIHESQAVILQHMCIVPNSLHYGVTRARHNRFTTP